MSLQQQLMEYIIQDIIEMLTVQQEMEYDEAMNKFYNSEVFEKLQDLFKDEMNFGHIIQAEI